LEIVVNSLVPFSISPGNTGTTL